VAVTVEQGDVAPPAPTPWYNKTPAVLGASAIGLVIIGVVVTAVTFVSRQANEPNDTPLNFVEPSFSATTTPPAPPTTTATITSTSPPVTSDIYPPGVTTSGLPTSGTPTSGTETSGTETSGTPTSDTLTSGTEPTSRVEESPRAEEDEDEPTSRKRPRTNVTRTFLPRPAG
jgi:hypothetical protein